MSQESQDVNYKKPDEEMLTVKNANETTNQQTKASYETVNRIMKKVVKCEKAWKDWFKVNQTPKKEYTPSQDQNSAALEEASGSTSKSNVMKIKTNIGNDEPRNITSIISPYMKLDMQVKQNQCSDCTQTICVPKHDLSLKSSGNTSSTGKYSLPASTLCAAEELKLEKFSDECCSCSEKDTDDECSERSCSCCSCSSSKHAQYSSLYFNKTSQHLTDASSMSSEDSTLSCVINSLCKISKSTNSFPKNAEYFKQELRLKANQEHGKCYTTLQKSDNSSSIDKSILRHVEKCESEISETSQHLTDASSMSSEDSTQSCVINSLYKISKSTNDFPKNAEYFQEELRLKANQEHGKRYTTLQKSDNSSSVDKSILRHVEKCESEISEEDLSQIQLENAEHISDETNSLIKMLNSLEELKADSAEQPRILKDQILEVTSVLKSENDSPNDYTTNLFDSCDDSFDNFLHNIKQMCALLTCEIDFMEEASKNLTADSETKRFLLEEYVNNTQNIITSFCRRWSIQ